MADMIAVSIVVGLLTGIAVAWTWVWWQIYKRATHNTREGL